jgi:cysteine desulfuration protein SufE
MNKSCPDPDETPSRSVYPGKLSAIVSLFEGLPEDEKRETLISYADQAARCAPAEGEAFDLEDVRKDEECTDTVGIFLKVGPQRQIHFRVSLGPQVQILTKAMTSILCKGLEGSTLEEVLDVPADFVPRIVGGQLVRVRSQTVYYVLTRMKSACRAYLNRERAASATHS